MIDTTPPTIIYFIIVAWGVATTIIGLYLSWKNNERYNKKIVQLLEEIKDGTAR